MANQPISSLKCHEAIAHALFDSGVETLFGLMGDGNMFMVDSYIRDCGGAFVASASEAGAATMALGYAVKSGKVGVCTVTHGPAMTNTMTALVEGVKGFIPMLLLCSDTPVEDRSNNQNISKREFIAASGAGFEQLRSPKSVAQDVANALRRAVVERRPIALNLPVDFDWVETDYVPVTVRIPEMRATVAKSDDIDDAIGIIAAAKRPLILAGRGAASPEGKAALQKLARRIDAPLATTVKAKDLFRGDTYNIGIFGTVSTPGAVELILQSDCILAFGASLNKYTTSSGSFVQGKRIVQINLEAAEIGKNTPPTVGLVGEPAEVANIIANWLDEADIPRSGFFTKDLRDFAANNATHPFSPDLSDNGTVDFRSALTCLNAALPTDRVLVTDAGRFLRETWTRIETSGPGSFVTSHNFSSIGLGLSYSVGAAFAAPDRPIVLVVGDGGFMHGGLVEFNTAVRYGLNLIVIVCNDGSYGAEHIKFSNRQMDPRNTLFAWPEFSAVAKALGGEGITVRSERDLEQVAEAIEHRKAPLLIELKLNADYIGPI